MSSLRSHTRAVWQVCPVSRVRVVPLQIPQILPSDSSVLESPA